MVTLKRILVATDFGEAADVAFAYGRDLARTFGAALDVLHVADNVFARGLPGEGYMLAYPKPSTRGGRNGSEEARGADER